MTTIEAVKAWKEMRDGVTYSALQDADKHALVHDIFNAINQARINGELSYEQLSSL